MFLGVYHFDGDPAALLPAYDRLMAGFPPEQIALHACVLRDNGISVYDSCPSREDFVAFSGGDGFRGAVAAAGLPEPRVEQLGEVHTREMVAR